MTSLDSARVLLVEDEFLIALEAEHYLRELGTRSIEIASTLPAALELAARGAFDVAVIDVNLNGEMSYPLAEQLAQRRIPIIFASGYQMDERRERIPPGVWLPKPYTSESLRTALLTALSP
jgi:CheY-like chemotaxis protein